MRTTFGGNSGYAGYSESIRSIQAKEDGRYPKTILKKEYGISQKKFDELLNRGVIYKSEWHHTSMYGNKTEFYSIDNIVLFCLLTDRKDDAYAYYMKSRSNVYTKSIIYNKEKRHLNEVLLDKKDIRISNLLNIGMKFHLTKRNNYSFSYRQNRFLLKYKEVRDIFEVK